MDTTFDTIYKCEKVFCNHTINLSECGWLDPWTMGLICLKAVEYSAEKDRSIVLPKDIRMISYLKRMHLPTFLKELAYDQFLDPFDKKDISEKENFNIHEIVHCNFRDEFDGRLSSKIRPMFIGFNLKSDEERLATGLVAELGNNVFDHNAGFWPTDFSGAIIIAQHNPIKKQIEVAVADAGVGFMGSLRASRPDLKTHTDAILLGLSGTSGRIGENRGNGLKTIQDWTINKFNGIVRIHSGDGLVVVDKNGQKTSDVFPILGTLASFMLKY